LYKRIAIVGIPCSGTKLLNHMLHTALPDWDYSPKERRWSYQWMQERIINKRPGDLFQYHTIKLHSQVALIITVRDPVYVLTSKHRTSNYWVSASKIGDNQPAPIKWYRIILQALEEGACVVKYENLVKNPDEIQELIGDRFGFKWKDKFSNFINVPLPSQYCDLNIVRPLRARKIVVSDLFYLADELRKCPELIEVRKKLGYEGISMS